MNRFAVWWSGSTLRRVGTVLSGITLLAVGVVLAATVVTEQSAGKAAAINMAGSLRMQTYRVAMEVADAATPAAAQRVLAALDGFESRLQHPLLVDALPAERDASLREEHAALAARWRDEVRPAALGALREPASRADFFPRVHAFVDALDRFVLRVEADLESRIQWLRLALWLALVAIVGLIISALALLGAQVFQPLTDLVQVARSVRARDFTARARHEGPDELGQLGADFNHMVEELGRLYGSLEAQIGAKTRDLERKNRALLLLYDSARAMARQPFDAGAWEGVLRQMCDLLGARGALVCMREPGAANGHPLVRTGQIDATPCGRAGGCGPCREAETGREPAGNNGSGALAAPGPPARGAPGDLPLGWPGGLVPLQDGAHRFGSMRIALSAGQSLSADEHELAQLVARNVAGALAAQDSREEHRRLALLEERSAIARELHDSLAQSLSYMKIQLLRLTTLLDAAQAPAARGVADELREGVSAAYRQLRELLTTFRLQLDGKGLKSALRGVVDDLRRRTGLDAELHDELHGLELSANEQVHLLQIVREALANVERHAGAAHVAVRLARAGDGADIELSVEDDGAGVAAGVDLASARPQHFGVSIMRDRARALGGDLRVEARAGGGTRVALRFPSRPFAEPVPAVQQVDA